MATKAEAFKASVEQSNHHAKPKRGSRMNPRVDEAGVPHVNLAADKESPYPLEDHAPGARPSRKSTRGAANHLKPDHSLNVREAVVTASPENRHAVDAAHARSNIVRPRGG